MPFLSFSDGLLYNAYDMERIVDNSANTLNLRDAAMKQLETDLSIRSPVLDAEVKMGGPRENYRSKLGLETKCT